MTSRDVFVILIVRTCPSSTTIEPPGPLPVSSLTFIDTCTEDEAFDGLSIRRTLLYFVRCTSLAVSVAAAFGSEILIAGLRLLMARPLGSQISYSPFALTAT